MKNIMLDANVVIEMLQGIEIENLETYIKTGNIYISAVTYAICWYFIEKGRVDSTMTDIFTSLRILTVSESTCLKGRVLSKESDVEDGIQIACCLENSIDTILTLEGGLFKYAKQIEVVKL
jgi:predicted nucleic acid-binding protein